MSCKLSLGVALSALAIATSAHAQVGSLFNVRIGPTFASRETNQAAFDSKGMMTFGAGGGFRFGHGAFSFDPSVLIVGKTTKTPDATTGGDERLKLQYMEFPLLSTVTLMSSHAVRPYIEAGPVIDLETRCRVEFVDQTSKEEVGCDIDSSNTIDRHKFDFGIAGGGGVDYRFSDDRHLAIEARYTHGLSNISASDDKTLSLKNRAVSLYLAYYFPFKPNV